ncbi:acyltransferase domain-containing protein [Streptomyces sp. NPDC127033]|uniref:acyltransferase domain-containing protein n=1 Tax=Streptomyces sp. NPDC127033 TaxID=3347110 RepID=UPI003654D847
MHAMDPGDDTHVAVIGMAVRHPGAADAGAYREQLFRGVDPGAVLEHAHAFDHDFFGFSPGEALITDPQHRVLLECSQHALEDAGRDPERDKAVIGVYAGSGTSPHAAVLRREIRRLPHADDWQIRIATGPDFLAARPAYKLGLTGPAVTVQGAGATMLMAVHTAVQALLAGDCDIALAGAVTVRPAADDHGDGTNGGLGGHGGDTAGPAPVGACGVLVLRLLPAALEDGDRVYAVIRGTAVGGGGEPDRVARQARAAARVAEDTLLPLVAVPSRGAGVTDTTPGLSALLRAVVAVESGLLPGTAEPWERQGMPRRVGVAASGALGLHAHVVVEEPPSLRRPEPEAGWQLLPVSARSEEALDELTALLGARLCRQPAPPLPDIAWTLQTGRAAHTYRRFVVARSTAEAGAALTSRGRRRAPTERAPHDAPPIVFAFPGQGGQHVGMARLLYRAYPGFRADLDACADLAAGALDHDLRQIVDPADPAEEAAAREALSAMAVGQPAVFAVEYALARLLLRWGVRPAAVVGHSLGAYAAACVAGVFSLPDAVALVVERGRLLQSLPAGSMAAVALPEAEVSPLLPDGLGIGAVNGPDQVAVSGPAALVERFVRTFPRPDAEVRLLRIATAGHSALVDPVLDEFEEYVSRLRLRPPRIPLVSDTTGTWADHDAVVTPGYWRAHMRRAVRFDDALTTLAGLPRSVLVEVGPGMTLTSLARRHPALAVGHPVLQTLPHPTDDTPGSQVLLTALGRLWLAGTDVDWAALHRGRARRRVRLPGHPFRRREFVLPDATGER